MQPRRGTRKRIERRLAESESEEEVQSRQGTRRRVERKRRVMEAESDNSSDYQGHATYPPPRDKSKKSKKDKRDRSKDRKGRDDDEESSRKDKKKKKTDKVRTIQMYIVLTRSGLTENFTCHQNK